MRTSLYNLFKGEVFKSRHEIGVHAILYFPIMVFAFLDGYLIWKSGDIKEPCTDNPWIYTLRNYIMGFYSLLYPIIISIFCFSLLDIEYKNDYLKKLFTLPMKTSNIFGAKIMYVVILSFISSLMTYLLMLLSGFLLDKLYPTFYPFSLYSYSLINFLFLIRLFIATLSIASLHLLLSTSFKTFVIPIITAGVGSIIAMLFQRMDIAIYIPYYNMIDLMEKYANGNTFLLGKVEIVNIAYIFIFMLLAYYKFEMLRKHGFKQ